MDNEEEEFSDEDSFIVEMEPSDKELEFVLHVQYLLPHRSVPYKSHVENWLELDVSEEELDSVVEKEFWYKLSHSMLNAFSIEYEENDIVKVMYNLYYYYLL